MPYVCIITERQDSRIWDGCGYQVSRPICSNAGAFSSGLREWVQLSNFGRRLGGCVIIVTMSDIHSVVGPSALGVTGESVDEYDAFSVSRAIVDNTFRYLLERWLFRLNYYCQAGRRNRLRVFQIV